MTPQQIKLVQQSWAGVMPRSEQVAEFFYAGLFERYPETRTLFSQDMTEQGRKLMVMLNTVVASLENLAPLLPVIRESGRRHAGYGVVEADYDKVADALISALQQGLQDAFTPEVQAAWIQAYGLLAEEMKNAAREGAAG
jgi:hemoglobin-like flavoprotein